MLVMAVDNIVIVESPAKAKTIEKFLGKTFKVVASYGHVRDLPKSKLGIDVEHNFEPQYMIPRGSSKVIKGLQSAMKSAKTIYLATDFDREGEAIAWHIIQAIPPQKGQIVKRITFAEITESAIKNAIKQPREIDASLVDAQQARRVLDRLVGYSLSPVLWKKIRSGLSAGRVQSVALKLIVDREREIQAFTPQEYWTLMALLHTPKKETFSANLTKIDGKKAVLSSRAVTEKITAELKTAEYRVAKVDEKDVRRAPAPPFITSSLQQEASRKLGFSAKRTMVIAQQLYEGINLPDGHVGLISYMRTDSYNLSTQATSEAAALIKKQYGDKYTSGPRTYKKKVRGAQEAHEAIRPTSFNRLPDEIKPHLTPEQYKVYKLIWQRALASQMTEAVYRQRGADITAARYGFRATGRSTLFDGFTKIYLESRDQEEEESDTRLPELSAGQVLKLSELKPEQHFTEPPPRFTEASLIKKLEEAGIGRPSTYAPTISTILSRGYIQMEGKQLAPQEVGFWVSDLLSQHFGFVVSEKFTAEMEDKLDDIAEGEVEWQPVIRAFYQPLVKQIETETPKIEKVKIPEIPTDEVCDKCGKPMVIKSGRFGQFMACSGFPECKNTMTIKKTIGVKCPEDGGDLVEKKTKRGRTFYGCSNYPACTYATWNKPTETAVEAS
jgi:DNA topoisomerase I